MLFSLFENSCKLRDLILNLQQRHGNGFFFFGQMFSINDMGVMYFCSVNIYKVMCDKYITPEMDVLDVSAMQMLCQSEQTQSGTVEFCGAENDVIAGPAVLGFLNDSFSARIAMASLSVFAVIGLLAILYARIFTFNKDRV